MSAATPQPYRSELRPGRDGFAQLLHAEWTKFRTVRGWVLGLVAAAVVTVAVGLLGPAGSSFECSGPNGQPCGDHTPPVGPGGEAVSDRFSFVHQPLSGDGSITAEVTSLTGDDSPGVEPWAKAGIILKESTKQGSAYAAMMVTGEHGVRMQHNFTGDTAGLPGAVSPGSPRWLRLTRSGDTFTGSESTDGTKWNVVGTVTLPGLPSTVEGGLFTASPEHVVTTQSFGGASSEGGSTSATATFDNVGLQGSWPRSAWTGDEVGGQPGGLGQAAGFQQPGGRFTVSGSGDIVPAVAGRGSTSKTIENGLVGVFAGLIAVIVVAALFITAEYRRGLIRTTLAAGPRRGRVLAAKAVVLGAVTFVTGLIAAAVSIPLVGALERAKGLNVFPVSALTELRVVAGAAALLAVSAILAMAVGTMVRRSHGAVTLVIVAVVLPYVLAVASVLPTAAAQWLLRFTPAAGFAIMQSMPEYSQVLADYTPADGYFPLTPWAGFAVPCGYAVLALGVATFLLRRRDA
jgi:ABC-type transport system involved in multi-copper enzyme maturation permease subunit